MNGVVIGVDGSTGAVAALRFTIEEARLRTCAKAIRPACSWTRAPARTSS